jgi:hypothetical protein
MLELAHSNELQSLGFMCCNHDEACWLSSRRGLFFCISCFSIQNSCFLEGCNLQVRLHAFFESIRFFVSVVWLLYLQSTTWELAIVMIVLVIVFVLFVFFFLVFFLSISLYMFHLCGSLFLGHLFFHICNI